jgi:N utilization substance protein B
MTSNPNTISRDYAVQFLYLCESERAFYFSQNHFDTFTNHYNVNPDSKGYLKELVQGVLGSVSELDETITQYAKNWSVSRMAITDRVILRMAIWELTQRKQPVKAVLNEAIDLAKKYGTEHSGAFVNGILDPIAAKLSL